MHRIYPLFSSSKGNCTYIATDNGGILIDCGVSFTRLKKAMELCHLDIRSIKAVFITHEHHDHTSGLKMLTKKTGAPVFGQSLTLDILYDDGLIESETTDIKESTDIDGVTVSCFYTSHDTKESCGYRITFSDGVSCCVCTDLGFVSEEVRRGVMGCRAVLLEANYDPELLRNSSYPVYLKKRIRSDIGHLSNEDCGRFAAELIASGTTRLILGHLSQENNSPQTAEYTVESLIAQAGFQRGRDYFLSCAPIENKDGGYVSF